MIMFSDSQLMRLRQSLRQTGRSLWGILPTLLGVLLLAALVIQLLPGLLQSGMFGHSVWTDTLLAALLGSISTAQPVVSYLFGGELLKSGVALMAVSALIVTWVTVGVIPLPAEAAALGWRFALWRNLWAFLAALLVSGMTVGALYLFEG